MDVKLNVENVPEAINPEQLVKWVQFFLTIMPSLLALLKTPSPDPSPAPIQSGPAMLVSLD